MKKQVLIGIALWGAMAFPAMAQTVVAEDDFNSYANGRLTGGTGWSGDWTGESGLYAGNGTVSIFGNGDSLAVRDLANPVTGNVLISFDFKLESGTLDGNDLLSLWLGSFTGPNIGIQGNCGGVSGCTDDVFASTSGVDAGGHSHNIEADTPYSLLGYLQKTDGSNVYNRFDLWINPTATELSTLTGADAFDVGASNLASFSRIGLRGANLDAGDVITVDNLRVSAVPEPSSLALLSSGLLLMFAITNRRRRQR